MVFTSFNRFWAANTVLRKLQGNFKPIFAAFAVTWAVAQPVTAQTTLIVRHDLGGNVQERLSMIAALRNEGRRVEIRGQCASACTMYLGLPNACVSRASRLGFHGPQSQFYGVSLPPDEFEYWSRIMASNYPAPIANWFMAEARETTMELVTMSGAQAIKMGAHAC